MKICFVTDHPFSERNGKFYSGGGVPGSMLERYMREGSSLIVIGRKSEKNNETLSSIPNAEFHLLRNYRGPQDLYIKYYALKKEIASLIERVDGVVIRVPSGLAALSVKICSKLQKPYAIEVCGSAFDSLWNHGSIAGKMLAPFSQYSARKIVREADYVLYVSHAFLQKEYPPKPGAVMVACSNVALPGNISNDILKERIERIETKEGDKIVLGQIGNLSVRYKGYHVVLKALEILKSSPYNFVYELVGGGSEDEILKQAKELGVEKSIVIRGRMDHKNIPDFMKCVDIYLHPSLTEGLPRVVVEAISNAVPCLVSSAGGTAELVPQEWVHKPGDYKKLAADLLKMAGSNELMKKAAITNFEKGKEFYPEVLNTRRAEHYNKFFKILKSS